MKKLILAVLFLLSALFPGIAFGASFAKDPLFLSRTPVTEGQTVRIYAVIENPDVTTYNGLLVFYDGATRIGSSTINIVPGGTQTASILWKPTAGQHAVNASLILSDGTVDQQVAVTFTIAAIPVPIVASDNTSASQSAASVESSKAIQNSIAGVSPQVASASAPAFTAIDTTRSSIAGVLDTQIASAKQKVAANPKSNFVGGSATSDPTIQNPTTGVWYWVYSIYLYALEALRWLVGNAGVFYPVLAVAFLYLIYRLYRRFRRPY